MGSTRLPGKVALKAAGKSLLELLVERLSHSATIQRTIVATSTNRQDDILTELCDGLGIPVFRGSEDDVLDRYFKAASTFGVEVIVRITSDCPLIDPALVDEMVRFFIEHRDRFDLVTNRHPLTYPDGLDADVMPIDALAHAWKHAREPHQREHTIPYFWEEGRRVYNFEHPEKLFYRHRWTIDYKEDYELIKNIFEALYKEGELFSTQSILDFLACHPELREINAKYISAR